jgi:hypothetical protein
VASKKELNKATVAIASAWAELPISSVPASKKWKVPYAPNFMYDVELWGAAGCTYPYYSYWPDEPLCEECSSAYETADNAYLWGGPCVNGEDALGDDDDENFEYPDNFPGMQSLPLALPASLILHPLDFSAASNGKLACLLVSLL